jgi:signal transduction histidine kinase
MMTANPATTNQANVLLVDDQPGKLLSYRAILDGLDANLIEAGSAREALDCLLRMEFAVVLVDVCMPELDGFELAAMIRDHPRFRRTAIIFVSGVALTELDRLRGYECGAVDYLPIPVVPEILRAKVNAFVELYQKTQQLEKLNRELERRVAERTAELEAANRRKDEFLAVLAHELRNPLAAIRTAAFVASRPEAARPALTQSAAVIERQIAHLTRLVDDLVDVSRITRGMIELRRDRVKIADVVAHAIETSQPMISDRQHTLTVGPISQGLEVIGDLSRLTQVIGNILHNAAKFTDRGGQIAIDVRGDGGDVVIRVRDNGPGIAPDSLREVFQMFTHSDRPLDKNSTGLGVGLALVRRLVEMHGGDVSAHSEGGGRGTELLVRLPLASPMDASDAAPTAARDTPAPGAGKRILVVDDNADAAEALALMLRLSGHEVETAFDGIEALEVAETFSPEIVLLDLGMPRLNGYDTARTIRSKPWGRDITLIALTGWGQPKDRTQTLEAGFNAHLVKPVGHEDLLAALGR